jgi:hypothetical protein
MGLNVGATLVVAQLSPLSIEELREQFWQYLVQRFPEAEKANLFGCTIDLDEQRREYDFGIRFVHYARFFHEVGYNQEDMDDAIGLFIHSIFPDGDLTLYFSP